MQDKVNDILAMATEAKEEFDAACEDQPKSANGRKALIKLRGELIRLYQMQTKLAADCQSSNEQQMLDTLLNDLEKVSKTAHEAVGFTYTPLPEMAALQ